MGGTQRTVMNNPGYQVVEKLLLAPEGGESPKALTVEPHGFTAVASCEGG